MITPPTFQKLILNWFEQHGRKTLPWQTPATPYRVWISEVMLQQTQVSTVINYFARFMARFPTLKTLAQAPIDDVLHLWSGLGYYARARNLHATAQIVYKNYAGQFPADLEALQTLPGIGRSTAGAILSLGFQQSAPILDGNVKRVLTRLHAIEGWTGQSSVLKQLWVIAETYTPTTKAVAAFNQAMMDLGATLCTPKTPQCPICPLKKHCVAYQQGQSTAYPTPKLRQTLPVRATRLLMLQNKQGEFLLEKRPPVGIWGGLWVFPECPIEMDITQWCQQQLNTTPQQIESWPSFRHTFSHYHLDITPILIKKFKTLTNKVMEQKPFTWYNPNTELRHGIPAPVQRLLEKIK